MCLLVSQLAEVQSEGVHLSGRADCRVVSTSPNAQYVTATEDTSLREGGGGGREGSRGSRE